jgi:hypothetical protein
MLVEQGHNDAPAMLHLRASADAGGTRDRGRVGLTLLHRHDLCGPEGRALSVRMSRGVSCTLPRCGCGAHAWMPWARRGGVCASTPLSQGSRGSAPSAMLPPASGWCRWGPAREGAGTLHGVDPPHVETGQPSRGVTVQTAWHPWTGMIPLGRTPPHPHRGSILPLSLVRERSKRGNTLTPSPSHDTGYSARCGPAARPYGGRLPAAPGH